MMSVGTCLHLFTPSLHWYAGLSGALYGLYVVAAYSALKKSDYFIGIGVGLLTIGKVGSDHLFDLAQENAELIGARVATEAHDFGVLSALVLIALDITYKLIKRTKKN